MEGNVEHHAHAEGLVGQLARAGVEAITPPQLMVAETDREALVLGSLWSELLSGACKIEHHFFADDSCGLVVSRGHASERAGAPLAARHAQILERALVEGGQKSVAIDLHLSQSSVTHILKQCFAFMGLSCWPSRTPLVLVLAAHAAQFRARERLPLERATPLPLRETIRLARPDLELCASLSPAEYAVMRLLVEGCSYQEIALLRRTSVRTVANQLAAVFHRLGISGRAELFCLLARRRVAVWGETPKSSRPLHRAVATHRARLAQVANVVESGR